MNAPVRYNAAPHDPVVTFQWERRGTGDDAEWAGTGSCPVCHCPMRVAYGYIQPPVPKGGFLGRRKEPVADVWYTSCRCQSLHMPRPANVASGCGALLKLVPPGAGTGNGG